MNKKIEINNMKDLRDNYREGYYDFKETMPVGKKLADDYVFDENLSVKKNREMIKLHNEKILKAKDEYWDRYYKSIADFNSDFKVAIKKELNINEEKANVIFNYIYNEKHSSGYYDMINYAFDFLELLSKLL